MIKYQRKNKDILSKKVFYLKLYTKQNIIYLYIKRETRFSNKKRHFNSENNAW